jgi:hypothetical protein
MSVSPFESAAASFTARMTSFGMSAREKSHQSPNSRFSQAACRFHGRRMRSRRQERPSRGDFRPVRPDHECRRRRVNGVRSLNRMATAARSGAGLQEACKFRKLASNRRLSA